MKIAMVLHKGIIFMRFYFVFVFLFIFLRCSHAERRYSNSSIKSMIVQEIMKKVSNITLHSLSKALPEKKETILNKIEHKLRKSAKAMGPDADKYIKFIMEEFKTKTIIPKEKTNVTEVLRKSINLRTKKIVTPSSIIESETKKEIIKDIANKIQTLAKGYMKNAKTIDAKKQIFEKIKKRIMDSAKQKHMQLHNKHEELKAYSSLIAQGVEESMRKMISDDAVGRRMESDKESNPTSDKDTKEETEEKTKEGIEKQNTDEVKEKNDTNIEDDMFKKTLVVMDIEEINKYKNLISETLNDSSIDPHCDEIVEDTCVSIQAFNKIKCGEGKTIPIENLCNGVIDCLHQVDEKNCTAQAMEKIRKATSVISDIEASLNRRCFAKSMDGNVLTAQNQVLRDVLQTQMDFLEKHVKEPLKATEDRNQVLDKIFIKKTVNDVNMILSTLSYALDGTLCAHRADPDHMGNNAARKFNDIEVDELDGIPRDPTWTPKSCTCKGHFCQDETCEAPCKRICWQKYSLNHWGCQAISGGSSVSLNVICDGKLDCFDETDESFCATGDNYSKFEAIKTYDGLLDLLSTKSKSYEFIKTRNKFIATHGLVRQLQKHTIKTNVDNHIIKNLRDEAFLMLVSIYEDLMQTARLDELDDRYLDLLSINEKLVTALKRSHAGNENLISPEGCHCRGGLCALRRCNRNCIQACLAEPVLTRYSCGTQNISVPVENICNGKNNCPNGEDEKGCIKDVCRAHHLVVLRHNLQNVGAKHRGSVIGEVLDTWKAKVTAVLFIEESTARPNHRAMVEIINRVLHDLVTAFAAMEDYRRMNSDQALQEFIVVSKIVKQTLKSCTN